MGQTMWDAVAKDTTSNLEDEHLRIEVKQIIQQPVTRNVVNGMSCQTALCKDRGETDYTAASDKKRCERHVLPDYLM
ncbi:hypothetical protein J6590_037930 [Homalodisca vitripennis]|nr:hypothetical protein J6590_037930 [Homalodisca vitripennis]